MKFLTRLRMQFRQWRRRRAARNEKGMLREFVYLDEVSVYSLIASRLGPIATEFTETETSTLQGEIASSLGASTGIAKADVSSQVLNSQSRGTQVLRKSIVQAAFKDLYEYELDSLGIKPIPDEMSYPKVHNTDELIAATQTSVDGYWIIDPDNLTRGQLFELEVQLEADPIFRVNAVASTVLEILEEDAAIFGLDANSDLVLIKSVGRILEKLLVGLVPIRGKAIAYCVVELNGKEWILNSKLLENLPIIDQPRAYPLFVVGVAEQALFWKDLRRILFSNAHYRVFSRIAQTGIHKSWTPVKLAHILESVMPGVANQINLAGLNALATISTSNQAGQRIGVKQKLMQAALVNYAELITNHLQVELTPEHRNQVNSLADHYCGSYDSQEARREAFEAIATYLIDKFGIEREPLIFAEYRANALVDAGLDLSGNPTRFASTDDTVSLMASCDRFLDSEFVAIYW